MRGIEFEQTIHEQVQRMTRRYFFGKSALGLGTAAFASLLDEIAWTRVLVMIVGGSTYAFTLVLVVFLLGIGLGSAMVARRSTERAVTAASAGFAQGVTAAGAAALFVFFSWLPLYILNVFQIAGLGPTPRLLFMGVAVGAVVFVVSNPYLPYNYLMHRSVVQSNVGNYGNFYKPELSLAAMGNAMRLLGEGMSARTIRRSVGALGSACPARHRGGQRGTIRPPGTWAAAQAYSDGGAGARGPGRKWLALVHKPGPAAQEDDQSVVRGVLVVDIARGR